MKYDEDECFGLCVDLMLSHDLIYEVIGKKCTNVVWRRGLLRPRGNTTRLTTLTTLNGIKLYHIHPMTIKSYLIT